MLMFVRQTASAVRKGGVADANPGVYWGCSVDRPTPQHIVTRLTLILGAVIHDTPRISDTIRHTNAEPGRGGKSPTPTTTTHHCKSTMYVFHYDLLLLLAEGYLISTRMYVCRILGWRILMEQ